jgi:metal-responsive CopG/Arc/MetJ family transcriptional regulator
MKRVTVNVDDEIGAEAEAIAEERGVSVSQFYAEAVEAAIREHKPQRALQRIEDEVMGMGTPVSREEFDEAQRDLRKGDPQRR